MRDVNIILRRGDQPVAPTMGRRALSMAPLILAFACIACSSVLGPYYLRQGKRDFEKSDYPHARAQFEKAIQNDPEQAEALYYLGRCYEEEKNFDQALSRYRQVVALDPRHREARGRLAENYYQAGLDPLAIREYQLLLLENPEDSQALFRLGNLAYRQDKYPAAAAYFQRVLQLNPEEARAYFNLGVIYGYDLGDPARARDYFQQYLARVSTGESSDQARAWLQGPESPATEVLP